MIRPLGWALGLVLLAAGPVAAQGKGKGKGKGNAALLLKALKHRDASFRRAALELLEERAAAAFELGAVPALARLARKDPDDKVRILALRVLAEMGPAAAKTVVPLAQKILKKRAFGRLPAWAVYALGKVKAQPRKVAPLVMAYLGSPSDFMRTAARGALIDMDDSVVPLMVRVMGKAPSRLREQIAMVLAARKPPAKAALPQLKLLLKQTPAADIKRRMHLLGVILTIEPRKTPQTAAQLLDILRRSKGYERYVLVRGMGEMGPAASAALPLLVAEFRNGEHKSTALSSIRKIVGPKNCGPVVPLLAGLLGSKEWIRAHYAAEALARCGRRGVDALHRGMDHPLPRGRTSAWNGAAKLPALSQKDLVRRFFLELNAGARELIVGQIARRARPGSSMTYTLSALLESEDTVRVRGKLLSALGRCGARALPALMRALGDRNKDIRSAAARALGALGPAAAPAVPLLLLGNPHEERRSWSSHISVSDHAAVVDHIGVAAIPALRRAIKHKDARTRVSAAYALGNMGKKGAAVVPLLARALDDEVHEVRQWSAWALGKMGPAAKRAVADLRSALTDPEGDVRQWAAEALGKMGGHAAAAVPDLIGLLEDTYADSQAAEALGRIGPKARAAIPELLKALQTSTDKYLREESISSLGQIGHGSPAVRRALRKALADQRASIRVAAGHALQKVGTAADVVAAHMAVKNNEDAAWRERSEGMKRLRILLQPPKKPEGSNR